MYKFGLNKKNLCRIRMHILNFSPAHAFYTTPASPHKHRGPHKQRGMASPAGRSSTSLSKIPEFLVGPIGQPMPAVGLGTASHPFVEEEVRAAVLTALELGYRHIDTAALYASERVVGKAMAEAVQRGIVVSREELFVTSKVWCTQCHPELMLPSLKESLQNLQMEYVDLYLIHWPMAVKPSKPHFPMKREDIVPMDLSGVWKAMEECHRLGLAKMIGVSNFTTKKLQELLAIAKIPPAINQVELNPTWQQKKLIDFCKGKSIQVAAYSPLGGQRIPKMNPVRQSDILEEIGKARGKSVAQQLN
ncbi:deoxymugineic acid synthase 1-D-like isoform X4 [Panicum virgatum]|uniref:deoxymugineic acid synthase 1-D-like isoform X4 n=1 Tax=Panicum virgatum TaxID=38727 RepID=UPI0019D64736|nr:deoxymugineic acid synthase 1-D-like isoform X4 [Panicum virgatum]